MNFIVSSLLAASIGSGCGAAGTVPLLIWVLPLLGALVLVLCPWMPERAARAVGFGFSLSTLILVLVVLTVQNSIPLSSFAFCAEAVHPLGVGLDLRLVPEALLLVLLVGIVAPMSLVASWKVDRVRQHFVFAGTGCSPWSLFIVQSRFLVSVLGVEPFPRVFSHQALGRSRGRESGISVCNLHHWRKRLHAARVCRDIRNDGHVTLGHAVSKGHNAGV